MPNHFHLLVRARDDDGVSLFMQKLTTAYSMYFNARNSRKGCLFEATFQSKYIESDEYLKYMFAYIHLNPVKIIDPAWRENGIRDRELARNFILNYEFSSFRDWMGNTRDTTQILNKGVFPQYFSSQEQFMESTFEWLLYKAINTKV